MLLSTAVEEYLYAKDLTPSARRWYVNKLTMFCTWAKAQSIGEVERVTALLVHRYIAYLRERTSEQFKRPLSSPDYSRRVKASGEEAPERLRGVATGQVETEAIDLVTDPAANLH
jgi:hypothetical protein